jgi:hypothetical protein
MSNLSPAAVLFDSLGNPVAVTLDGGVYKLEVLATVAGSGGAVASVTTQNNTNSLAVESRSLEGLLAQILAEVRVMRQQLAIITDEEDPL